MSGLGHDLRYALRTLAKNPGFAATAILTLALGIGTNAAVFSVVDAVLWKPLGYPHPARLAAFEHNVSALDFSDLTAQVPSIEKAGAATLGPLDLTGSGAPVKVDAAMVTGDLFELLGARTRLGRGLGKADDRSGGERVAVLTFDFWRRQFASQGSIVGASITLAGQPYTVVGVLEPGFQLPERRADVFVPLRVAYAEGAQARGAHLLRAVVRLRAGIAWPRAQQEVDAAAARLARAYPDADKGLALPLVPLRDEIVASSRRGLELALAAVGLVLLIACANLASLLLARAAGRRPEMALRTALGARRSRLVRQLLTESVLLALAGGAAGLLAASWLKDLLVARLPQELPRASQIALDGRVVAFAAVASVLTGLLFGAAPGWKASRVDFGGALKGGRSIHGSSRLHGTMVVLQIGLAFALLTGSALLVRTLVSLSAIQPGFQVAGAVTFRLDLPEARYREVPEQTVFRERLIAALSQPPIERAAMVSEIPLGNNVLAHNFVIDGRAPIPVGEEPELASRSVLGDYFATMGIPLRAGRDFTPRDRAGAPLVGLVNESTASRFFPGQNPIGQRIRWARLEGPPQWITVVGVVANVHQDALTESDAPALYTPYAQSLQSWKRWMEIVLRPRPGTPALEPLVRSRVASIDPLLPVGRVKPLSEVVDAALARRRFQMELWAVFAIAALLLASIGTAGVAANAVRQRASEVGLRMALGARPEQILREFLGRSLRLVLFGLGAGLALAALSARALTGFLYAVPSLDPASYLAAAAILAAAALAASLLPALRAARIDPMTALRNE